MKSLILQTATRFMFPLLLLFSLFLLLRGHNDPGGGFVGGLVAASAFALFALSYDVPAARRALGFDPQWPISIGLLIALASGAWSLAFGWPPFAHRFAWGEVTAPAWGKLHLGTPLLFDLGVYLVVLGVTLTIILTLAEEAGKK